MQYHIAPLFCRPWTLNGISPRLIESHYEHIYGEALNRLNEVTKELESIDPSTAPADVINRLKRDQFTELNSTLLHELYFASLGGDGRTLPEIIADAIARDFGSVDHWRHEFAALATAMSRGSGWVLLTYVPRDGRLINQTASDHSQNIAGGIPVLAIDMYEHAYQLDFGANAKAYIAAFMRNIDWNAVQARYDMRRKSGHHDHLSKSSSPTCRPSPPKKSRQCWIRALPCRSSIRAQGTIRRERKI
jgi:Fe-Mn family superoxide dismutase